MKYLDDSLLSMASPDVMKFIEIWQSVTGRPITKELCLCDVLDLLRDFSPTFHFENSDGRFFEHIFVGHKAPSVVGWDGDSLLYNLWYEAVSVIKRIIVVESMKRAA